MSAVMPESATAAVGRRAETLSNPTQPAGPAPWPARNAAGNVSAEATASARKAVEEVPTESAADRLEHSRARLRMALMDIAHPPERASRFVGVGLPDLASKVRSWLRSLPGATLVIESIESWWAQHPLRTAGVVAKQASEELVAPIARRSPYSLIIGATVIGALFAASRPWRWLLRPALFMGLVPQIAAHALRRMPVETWVKMAGDLAGASKRQTNRRRREAAAADPLAPLGPL